MLLPDGFAATEATDDEVLIESNDDRNTFAAVRVVYGRRTSNAPDLNTWMLDRQPAGLPDSGRINGRQFLRFRVKGVLLRGGAGHETVYFAEGKEGYFRFAIQTLEPHDSPVHRKLDAMVRSIHDGEFPPLNASQVRGHEAGRAAFAQDRRWQPAGPVVEEAASIAKGLDAPATRRRAAVQLLRFGRRGESALYPYLRNHDPVVRQIASDTLQRIASRRSLLALYEAMQDPVMAEAAKRGFDRLSR